jgi:hypothetical protein
VGYDSGNIEMKIIYETGEEKGMKEEKSILAGHNGVARYVGLSSPAMMTMLKNKKYLPQMP